MSDQIAALAKLRVPFPENQISKLPKETKAQIEQRKADKGAMLFNCPVCGGHHHKNAVHLDYVGHAALTDRLLDTDPEWTWEPVAFAPDGLPALDRNGGMWIRLTVCGVTRLGYGSADGKQGGDAVKEIIGDALRNAAMRFGAALDLWHKGDLHADEAAEEKAEPSPQRQQSAPAHINAQQLAKIQAEISRTGTDIRAICAGYHVKALAELNAGQFAQAMSALRQRPDAPTELGGDGIPEFGEAA